MYSPSLETINEFEEVLEFELKQFLSLFIQFSSDFYPQLVRYYEGDSSNLDPKAVEVLNTLIDESEQLSSQLQIKYQLFTRIDYWRFTEYLDNIIVKVKTFTKLSKYLGSTRFDVLETAQTGSETFLQDGETFEDVVRRRGGDEQNDWSDIVFNNKISELDYKAQEGGLIYTINTREAENISITSVIDNLFGERLYGLDIDANVTFENNDFVVLSYRDTFRQSVLHLLELRRNDLFYLRNVGLPRNLLGSNLGALSAPFLTFEIKQVFDIDDSIFAFAITDLDIEGTSMFLNVSVRSYYDYILDEKIKAYE